MTGEGTPRGFHQSIDDVERSVRVPPELQVELQDVDLHGEYVAPEDLDRVRLVAAIDGAGRLNPRK